MLQVAFLAGCLYTLVGILRLGWVTNFLSHSVIAGFMTGASVIIGLSQVGANVLHLEETSNRLLWWGTVFKRLSKNLNI